ncbi:MAG: hypothetical protein DBX59_01365 [Bacillota bacterium]|nr:MAG: hypothetical protein DBX59_01365 [Bacillota bacterium]
MNQFMVKYLREFLVLYRVGNYLYASEELFLSESNLHKHIKSLEDDLGHPLFRKEGRQLVLTEFGQLFLEYAQKFVALNDQFQQAREEYNARAASTVRVAVVRSLNCDHMVNMLSDHFVNRYPQYHISPGEYSRDYTPGQLFEQGYELVFGLADKSDSQEYSCYPWASDHLLAVLPQRHPLAGQEQLKLRQLGGDPFLFYPEETFLHKFCMRLCRQEGFEPWVDFTIHGTSNLGELVSDGVGVSLVPSSDILSIRPYNVSTAEIDPSPLIYLNLYYRSDHSLSKVAKTFLQCAMDIHQNHSQDIPFMGPEGKIEHIFF